MITLTDITIGFSKQVLAKKINLVINKGDVFVLEGPNGSGKSTLGKVLLGDISPLKGLRKSSFNTIAYVPQRSTVDHRYPLTLADITALGFVDGWRFFHSKTSRKNRQRQVTQALDNVGLSGLGALAVSSSSGGQLQRALIARALICNPQFILLDEPFSNLDYKGRQHISDLLKKLNQQEQTSLFIIDHRSVSPFVGAKELTLENGELRTA